ncbi:MAG: pseudouridine synthase [Sphaerochaetaceae bacterium]|nr:pseudouridine synthase [Sphaerochaetaceae bacterium]
MKIEYPIRLQSYLAKSGFGSRRSCETLIKEGRVQVNLSAVTEMGTKVNEDDVITVDGVLAEASDKTLYYALNKPRGYVCTNYDPNETLYARDLITIPEKNLLFHVGRLDKESSGLILYTNDGNAAQKITHPSYEIEKEYAVSTKETLHMEDLQKATKGLFIDSQKPYTITRFSIKSKKWVYVTLKEGKNRELRKIFTYLGYTIDQLVRIRIGTIELGSLKEGRYRQLSKGEISQLLDGKHR